jgi:4-hydroxy-tetrahydrodipicolinate reductase
MEQKQSNWGKMGQEKLKVCVGGATGWVGKPLCEAIVAAEDMTLSGAVARSSAGRNLGNVTIAGTVAQALESPADVLVDYTRAEVVMANVMAAIERGVHVVIGSSGLTDEEFAEIDRAAREKNVGVIAAGNFAVTAVLLQRFACEAAKYLSHWEIVDYGWEGKPDAPSGAARELAFRLGEVRQPETGYPVGDIMGEKEARGAALHGTQVHSVRLPGFPSSVDITFGAEGERLYMRHDGLGDANSYISGTMLAIRKVREQAGLVRGLDRIMRGPDL